MLLDQIQKDTITAMKSKDSERVGVLRMLTSELKNQQISLRGDGGELTDEDCVKVLAKEAKKRKESIAIYKENDREELAAQEEAELKIIEEYLPELMSEEEVKSIVQETINSMDNPNFGEVMKAVMPKFQGKADGKVVSAAVNELL